MGIAESMSMMGGGGKHGITGAMERPEKKMEGEHEGGVPGHLKALREEKFSQSASTSFVSSPRVTIQWPPLRGVHTTGGYSCNRDQARKGSEPSGPGRKKSKSTTSLSGMWAGFSAKGRTLMPPPWCGRG